MTRQAKHNKKAEPPKAGAVCLSLLLFFSFAFLLRRADIDTNCMREGLALCARAIVPSLFPFMVLSELLVATGAGECLTSPLARSLGKLLGLSPAGCSAVVLASHLLPRLERGELRNILILGTGAMMSPSSIQQGEAIPGVAHLVRLCSSEDIEG